MKSTSLEMRIAEQHRNDGHLVFTDGWPDLLGLSPNGDIFAEEVKSLSDRLRGNQESVLALLRGAGIDARVNYVDDNLKTIHLDRGEHPEHIGTDGAVLPIVTAVFQTSTIPIETNDIRVKERYYQLLKQELARLESEGIK